MVSRPLPNETILSVSRNDNCLISDLNKFYNDGAGVWGFGRSYKGTCCIRYSIYSACEAGDLVVLFLKRYNPSVAIVHVLGDVPSW